MLPKKERFSSKDFSNKDLFRKSKKIYTLYGFFVVLGESFNKRGIILSKKNFKTAVLRNKYKRLFYNTLLGLQKNKKDLKEISFVFHPKKNFTKEELEKDLSTLFVL